MSRRFNSTSADIISLADNADIKFLSTSQWTVLSFFRVEETASDNRTIISKYGGVNNQQFLLRVDRGTAPQEIEVWHNGAVRISGVDLVELNTWYLVSASCNGSATLRYNLYGIDGTQLGTATAATTGNQSQNTAPVQIGIWDSANDPMFGRIAYTCYIDGVQLTTQEISRYLRRPYIVATSKGTSTKFFLPLLGRSPEPDFSGRANNFTVAGTTITDMPPAVSPMMVPSVYSIPSVFFFKNSEGVSVPFSGTNTLVLDP